MTLFAFKEDSILNDGFARGVNYFVWGLIIIFAIIGESSFSMPIWGIPATAVFSGIGTALCLEKVMKKTTFFEWDYTERKKKERFIACYVMICAMLCSFIAIDAVLIYKTLVDYDLHWFFKVVPIVLLLFFMFNVLNIVSLFYPLFENDIHTAYKIQKKPDNWQDDGPEINNDDEVAEIMRRDWGK